jgi:hypothetical protein
MVQEGCGTTGPVGGKKGVFANPSEAEIKDEVGIGARRGSRRILRRWRRRFILSPGDPPYDYLASERFLEQRNGEIFVQQCHFMTGQVLTKKDFSTLAKSR